MAYIVEIEEGCWLADWDGDPGRTLVESSAIKFDSFSSADSALEEARQYRKFPTAEIINVE